MGFRLPFLAVVDKLATLQGPSAFDICPSQVTLRIAVWASGRVGSPSSTPTTVTDSVFPQIYPVEQVSGSMERVTAGKRQVWNVAFGPITPSNGAGVGYTPQQLKPGDLADGTEVTFVITGEFAGIYRMTNMDLSDPFGYMLYLERQAITP